MFDNILFQSASGLLTSDITSGRFPSSILFAGPRSSGKLSCALETARILSCSGKGEWNCACPSCLHHKAMTSRNIVLAGPGDRNLEIAAAAKTLCIQNQANSRHLEASRYLFIRAVRKLTSRFSQVLWEGEEKLSKFSPVLQRIDELLEPLQPGRVLPENSELSASTDEIIEQCRKLENSYLYDSLPVSQIRNISSWCHLASTGGKKVVIIENADRMAESARNALLKILEEPPADVVFILTTSNRGAMLQTILSRVRVYSFFERPVERQREVLSRVFHYTAPLSGEVPETIDSYLQTFLPVTPESVRQCAASFFASVAEGHVPDIPKTVSACLDFKPPVVFRIFMEGIVAAQKNLSKTAAGAESSARIMDALRETYTHVTVYNQNPSSALEELVRSLMQINFINHGVFRSAI